MSLTVAVQMDPIASINITGDSTFALMLEAQARGHSLLHYHHKTLALHNGQVTARGEPVIVRDVKGDHYTLGERQRFSINDTDIVLMRQDPPFNMDYITCTHILERVHPKTLVVNDPKSVRNAPEKLYVLDYAEYMPPTLITRDADEIATFRKDHGDIVIKPLYGNGGRGVFLVHKEDPNFGSLTDLFDTTFPEAWVLQQYRPEVREGDKRILLVDGEFAGAINRIPASDDLRSNMVRGAEAIETTLTPREEEICAKLGPDLRDQGIIFAGIDVIGGYLTEINVTSPTGIRAVAAKGGPDAAAMIWDAIERRIGSLQR